MDRKSSAITTKGQVTIPLTVREELGLHTGDRILWSLRSNGTVEVRKEVVRPIGELVGLLGKPRRSATIEDMDAAIRHHAKGARHARRG